MSEARWQVSGPMRLVWVEWGDEFAVYHTGNGDTHLLNPLAAHLLHLLEAGPQRVDDMVSSLAELSYESDVSPHELIQHVLSELHRLDIVEQA